MDIESDGSEKGQEETMSDNAGTIESERDGSFVLQKVLVRGIAEDL
jgi:hypothetical protein